MTDKYETLIEAARAAALAVAAEIRRLIEVNGRAVAILDAAGVPDEFFETLTSASDVNWTQVIVFQGSEYVGVDGASAESRQQHLIAMMVSQTPIIEFYPLRANAANQGAAVVNFTQQVSTKQPDLAVAGFEMFAESTETIGPMVVRRDPDSTRAVIALSPEILVDCPALVAIGNEPIPASVLSHGNSRIFQYVAQ